MSLLRWTSLLVLLAIACGDDDTPVDDAGAPSDAPPADTSPLGCRADPDCDDGLFCNGVERCLANGECLPGSTPCMLRCDEAADRCDDCEDADEDGFASADCGGSDCDDEDPDVRPTATEVCDFSATDEDCNPATFGDIDEDGDGFVDAACCNGDDCAPDCDDARAMTNPDAPEICNDLDDDCDGRIDEACDACLDAEVETGPGLCGDGCDNDGDGSADCGGDPSCGLDSCEAPIACEDCFFVVGRFDFGPSSTGRLPGRNLDGLDGGPLGDTDPCGIPDVIGLDGTRGVDNAFAALREAASLAGALEVPVQSGDVLVLVEPDGPLSPTATSQRVRLHFGRMPGGGLPIASGSSLAADQTFDVLTPTIVDATGRVEAGTLIVGPFDVHLQLAEDGSLVLPLEQVEVRLDLRGRTPRGEPSRHLMTGRTTVAGFGTFFGSETSSSLLTSILPLYLDLDQVSAATTVRVSSGPDGIPGNADDVTYRLEAGDCSTMSFGVSLELVPARAGATVVSECLFDGDCDDGSFCNGAERCVANVCSAGSLPACTDGRCDETNDRCFASTTPIGARCTSDAACGGSRDCITEAEVSSTIGGATDPVRDLPASYGGSHPTSLFPGGYCTRLDCNPAVAGTCGAGAACVPVEDDFAICLESCTPNAVDNDRCRDGYQCRAGTGACVGGCSDDAECRVQRRESNGIPGIQTPGDCLRSPANCGGSSTRFDELVWVEEEVSCDLATFRCAWTPPAGADAGDACQDDFDCERDGICLRDADPSAPFWGSDGFCTKVGCEDLPCAGDGSCVERRLPDARCMPACTVGAGTTVDPATWLGATSGCGPGQTCVWSGAGGVADNGYCLPSTNLDNGVTTENVGGTCTSAAQCWSPFGEGDCLDGLFAAGDLPNGYCTVFDCGAPGRGGAGACGAGNVCVALSSDAAPLSLCLQGCANAAECSAGLACADVTGSGTRACIPGCASTADCRTGQTCVGASASAFGRCSP
ncbi:MAG: putative metal-binding motif-containing protein [Polyangiales bacterium]